MAYDAFISYSHAADGRLAPRVQSALHRFAKPLLSLRALHVFRDKTSLAATPGLWTSIVKALDQSRFFILMASPDAAASEWVGKEIEHWLSGTPTEKGDAAARLLIILTDGEIVWDPEGADFDWQRTDALPRVLSGVFREEPLYVDMRVARTATDLSLHNPSFRDQIADLAATISGRPKDRLIGEDVRIVRRNRRLAWSAGVALALLATIAGVMAFVATMQRDAARSRELAARAVSRLAVDPHDSLQLAIEGVAIDTTDEALLALREALLRSHRRAPLSAAGTVGRVRFGPGGARILGTVCTADEAECSLQLWQAATGDAICRIAEARSARFNSDGARIVTGEQRVFDAESCEPLPIAPAGLSLEEPAPRMFEVVDDDGTAFIRRIESGDRTRQLPTLRDPIGGQVHSPNNRFVVTWSDESFYSESGGGPSEIGDKAIRLWGVEYSDEDAVLVGHDRATNTATFSSDSSFVVSGSEDRTARIWMRDSGEQFAVLRGHSDGVVELAASPDGSRVVTVQRDGQAWLWEPGSTLPAEASLQALFSLRHGRPLPNLEGERRPLRVPEPSRNGRILVAELDIDEVGVWDAETGALRAVLADDAGFRLRGWPCGDGRHVVTVNGDPRISAGDDEAKVWDVGSGQVVATLDGADGPLFGAACSPDGEIIVTISQGGTVLLWSASSYAPIRRIDVADGGRMLDVAFDGDGSRIVTAHRDSIARIWDIRTGRLLVRLLGHAGGVQAAAFSPDDNLVVTVGDDHTRVWDAASGKQIGDFLGRGEGTVFISHDCSKLVIGDSAVRLHDFGACGPEDTLLARATLRVERVEGD